MTVLAEDARASVTRSFRFETDVLNVLDEEAGRVVVPEAGLEPA